MASPSELSVDCKPHSYSLFSKSFGDHADDQTQKLEEALALLEQERFKIDGLKRELPLCMQLLTNAVEVSRQQLQACRENQGPISPVLEEFIPIKNSISNNSENKSPNISDKANWMTTAQLWSQTGNNYETKPPQNTIASSPKETDHVGFNVNISPKLALDTKHRNGGAFLPFSKERNSCRALSDLALASADNKERDHDKKCSENESENGRRENLDNNNNYNENSNYNGGAVIHEQVTGVGVAGNNSTEGQTNSNNTSNNSTQRKARRCWSPELHRRFVNALHMLGGSQAATPKQIRELMKVDGLTNDEVKSHLQKYRLHTRGPSPSQQAAGAPAHQLVVLGGIWVPSEYATAAAAARSGPPTLYHHPSPHTPPHFCASSPLLPQDFYAAATPPPTVPPTHQQLHLQNQFHVYKATSQGHSSPESDIRGLEDRSESIEYGKSDSSSWKGENGIGERKGFTALRKDGEESNGSQITLKF